MQGLILSYRRGKHTQNVNQMLVDFGVDNKEEATKLLGKKLIWKTSSGKEIKGEVIALHGSKGIVRAKFERNLPGQAIRTNVLLE